MNMRRIVTMNGLILSILLILLSVFPVTAFADDDRAFITSFVARLRANHPALSSQDVYKALFQDINGMEHGVGSETQAYEGLTDELLRISQDPTRNDRLIEFLADDLRVSRVNLRPYMGMGGDPQKLARALYLSSREFKPDPDRFKRLWLTYLDMVSEGMLNFPVGEANAVDGMAKESGYRKNFSHSDGYHREYSPAYRVILTKYLETLW